MQNDQPTNNSTSNTTVTEPPEPPPTTTDNETVAVTDPHKDETPQVGPNGERPIQIVIFVGDTPSVPPYVKTADLNTTETHTPNDTTENNEGDNTATSFPPQPPVVQALENTGLSPSDLRTRVQFHIGPNVPIETAIEAYVAASTLAGRRLNVVVNNTVIDIETLDSQARKAAQSIDARQTIDVIQVGAEHPTILSVDGERLTMEDTTKIVAAKTCRLVLNPDPATAVAQFVLIAGLRNKGTLERFPYLATTDTVSVTDETVTLTNNRLDHIRRAAMLLRRETRSEDRTAIVEPLTLSTRQRKLVAAAATPVEVTLSALGSRTPDGDLWHCPRPERHTNGDATPSMRVVKGKVRCYRCDAERIDSLNLVMDTKACSADEAADWLLNKA